MITIVAALAHITLPAGAFGGALLALGMMAQGLLLTNANGLYFKLKQQGLADDAIRGALANKAQASVGLAFAALAAALLVQVAVLLLPE